MSKPSGLKYDSDKPEWAHLPWTALEQVVKVQDYGAAKYGRGNWSQVENLETRYLSAALRHVVAHAQGEDKDSESGLPHLAHAVTSLLFILEHRLASPEKEMYNVPTFSQPDYKIRG